MERHQQDIADAEINTRQTHRMAKLLKYLSALACFSVSLEFLASQLSFTSRQNIYLAWPRKEVEGEEGMGCKVPCLILRMPGSNDFLRSGINMQIKRYYIWVKFKRHNCQRVPSLLHTLSLFHTPSLALTACFS